MKVLKLQSKGSWQLKTVNDMMNYYSMSVLNSKTEWENHKKEKSMSAMAIIGTAELTDGEGDRHDAAVYTSSKIFEENVTRAAAAFDGKLAIILDGKQKVRSSLMSAP